MSSKPRIKTDTIVVHCAATKKHMDIGANEIRRWHRERGWDDIGYHYVIRRGGDIEPGRAEHLVGAHVAGHNSTSIGICLVGGLSKDGGPEDNFTTMQRRSLRSLINTLLVKYPGCRVIGHRDLDPKKDCPSFNVTKWWNLT